MPPLFRADNPSYSSTGTHSAVRHVRAARFVTVSSLPKMCAAAAAAAAAFTDCV